MFFRDKRERLDKVAAISVVLKRNRSEETGVNGGDDDAAGVVGERAVGVRSVQLRVREMENAMVLEEAITRFMIFIYLVVIKGIIYSGEVLKKAWGEPASPRG